MTFNGRKLTAKEMQLYIQGRCICCGQERKTNYFCNPDVECIKCYKTRTRIHDQAYDHLYKSKQSLQQTEESRLQ